MMNASREQIEEYLYQLAKQQHPQSLLDEMEVYASEEGIPLVGRAAGAYLELATRSVRATRVVELGSGIGYGSFWFAKAVGTTGEVICLEPDPRKAAKAQEFFDGSRFTNVRLILGDVLESLRDEDGEFDVVYCDATKDQYPACWLAASPRIRIGGLWLSDNALWHGGAVTGEDVSDSTPGFASAVRNHNHLVTSDPSFVSSLVPIRDGILSALRVA